MDSTAFNGIGKAIFQLFIVAIIVAIIVGIGLWELAWWLIDMAIETSSK